MERDWVARWGTPSVWSIVTWRRRQRTRLIVYRLCIYTSRWTLNSVTDTSNRRPDNKQYINASSAAAEQSSQQPPARGPRRHDRADRHVCSVRGNTKLKYSQLVGSMVNQRSSLHERHFDHCNGSTSWLRARRSASLHNTHILNISIIIQTERFLSHSQPLIYGTVFRRRSLLLPSLSIFCHLKSHLFSLSYPAFWLLSFVQCPLPAHWLVILEWDTIIFIKFNI